jgi:hypothetical protein
MSATKLFKNASIETELAQGMAQRLVANRIEKKHSFEKLASAVDHLQVAAEIFDDTGFHAEAEALTQIIEALAEKSQPDKKKV